MAKKPELPTPIIWKVYKIASKAVWLGAVEAVIRGADTFSVKQTRKTGKPLNLWI
jgi:hypothetical protein